MFSEGRAWSVHQPTTIMFLRRKEISWVNGWELALLEGATALCIRTLSIMALGIMTLSITTLDIKIQIVTLSITGKMQHLV